MNKDIFTESIAALIQCARQAGYRVSATQIARWHRLGLLPKPWQRPLGRGKGTETLYPTGTGRQLLALCEISLIDIENGRRARKRARSPQIVGWQLWWRGYQTDTWQSQLIEAARQLDGARKTLGIFAEPGAGRKLTLQLALSRSRKADPLFKHIRKIVRAPKRDRKSGATLPSGNDATEIVMRLIGQIANGEFADVRNVSARARDRSLVEGDVLERAMGLHRARTRQWPALGPMLCGPIGSALADVSQALKAPFSREAKTIAAQEFAQARDELRLLLKSLSTLGRVLQDLFGRHAFGLGTISQFADSPNMLLQSAMLLMWTRVRRIGWVREGVEAILNQVAETQKLASAYSTAELIRREIPELATALSAKRLKAAAKDRGKWEVIAAEISRFCEAHPATIAAFQSRHPEFKAGA